MRRHFALAELGFPRGTSRANGTELNRTKEGRKDKDKDIYMASRGEKKGGNREYTNKNDYNFTQQQQQQQEEEEEERLERLYELAHLAGVPLKREVRRRYKYRHDDKPRNITNNLLHNGK